MEFKNKTILPIIILSTGLWLAMVFFTIWFFNRTKPFYITIVYFMVVCAIMVLIGILVGILIWLFKKQRMDMVYLNKQRIISACKLSAPKFSQVMFLKGSDELESRFVGFVYGICRIKSEPVKSIDMTSQPEPYIKDEKDTIKPLTFIAFKRSKGIMAWIEPMKLFCGAEGDFTHLSADIIYLKDMTFAPPLYDIFFLQRHYRDTSKIDEPIKEGIYRYLLQENLKELKNIADEYLAISPAHQKALEKSRLEEIKKTISPAEQKSANG